MGVKSSQMRSCCNIRKQENVQEIETVVIELAVKNWMFDCCYQGANKMKSGDIIYIFEGFLRLL